MQTSLQRLVTLAVAALALGACTPWEPPSPSSNSAEQNPRQATAVAKHAPRKATAQEAQQTAEKSEPWTHQVKVNTAYYTAGPQQMRPPDGYFRPGTKVRIVQQAGSYVLVEAEGGTRAYVAADALEPLQQR